MLSYAPRLQSPGTVLTDAFDVESASVGRVDQPCDVVVPTTGTDQGDAGEVRGRPDSLRGEGLDERPPDAGQLLLVQTCLAQFAVDELLAVVRQGPVQTRAALPCEEVISLSMACWSWTFFFSAVLTAF